VQLTVTQFTFIGELLFPLWLLVRGIDASRWERREAASALRAGG
jgi:hypothetical protein